jgi:hypothetical protein
VKWIPKTWNDILSVVLLIGLPAYWWAANPNEMIIGATVAVFTLVAQFYFRRAPEGPVQ